MTDKESEVAWTGCPLCDEDKCVGRYKCQHIADYIKKQEGEDG